MDLESPSAGRLGEHLFDGGTTIPVGTVVVYVLEGDEQGGSAQVSSSAADGTHDSERDAIAARTGESVVADAAVPSAADGGESEGEYRTPHSLSPRQRRLQATQPARDGANEEAAAAEAGKHRAAVANAVAESWRTIPHFGVTSHIWAETLLSIVRQVRQTVPDVTVTDFLLRAFALALDETRTPGDGSIGLAVATERGVAIPVIADVGRLGLLELAASREDALNRARAGRMAPVDGLTPAFSLSNLGVHDVEYFTGIIPVGQSGLLTIGRAKPRPVAADGLLAIATTLYATLNVDHRSLDGVHAGAVLDVFSRILNDPAQLAGQ
jgi:pyruvate dehydrogenase E2 component (dihydrolipoamide acetyltransferase)